MSKGAHDGDGFRRSRGFGSGATLVEHNVTLQTALMDVSLIPLIGLYASFEIKHPRDDSNRSVCDALLTRFQATHRWTVFSGTWDWMWKMKAHSGWAHSWACVTRVLMGDDAAPACDDGNWMRVVEWYMALWARWDSDSFRGRKPPYVDAVRTKDDVVALMDTLVFGDDGGRCGGMRKFDFTGCSSFDCVWLRVVVEMMPWVEALSLRRTKVSDISPLAGCTALVQLNLSESKKDTIDTSVLSHISGLKIS